MKKWIPGHARGATIWMAILLAATKLLTADNWIEASAAVLIVTGMFLVDQSLHLVQEDHSAPPPTPIERWMQKNRPIATLIGAVVATIGMVYT